MSFLRTTATGRTAILPFFATATASIICWTATACTAVTQANDYRTVECTSNRECLDERGANWICRRTDRTCQPLLTADCQTVLGAENLRDDSTILFGALFAVNGANSSLARGQIPALQLAFADFAPTNGLPPIPGQSSRRQMAVLICDDSATNDVALRSVTHMTDDLGIQAIVGPSWSGPTINLLTKHTLERGVLVVAAGTTSPDFTNLQKNGLYYRTIGSTAQLAPAIARTCLGIEEKIKIRKPGAKVKIAVPFKGDSFGKGTTQVLLQNLTINGVNAADPSNAGEFFSFNYGNPANAAADPLRYSEAAAKILALLPDIVVLVGTTEAPSSIMSVVEEQWPPNVPRPYWVFTHSQVANSFVQQVGQSIHGLRARVLGVTFGSITPAYTTFRSNFLNSSVSPDISPDSIFASTTYDAFYSLVYAVASIGSQPLTGANIGAGFANLVPPTDTEHKITIGPQDLNKALNFLHKGEKVDLNGSSGSLDFNLATGDVVSESQVWCLPGNADGSPAFPTFSGYYFDTKFNPVGTIESLTTSCGVKF